MARRNTGTAIQSWASSGDSFRKTSFLKAARRLASFRFWKCPPATTHLGLGNGEDQIFLPVWLQKSWGEEKREWTVYGGGGYWINPGTDNKDYSLVGVVLQKQVADNLTLGCELFHTTSSAEDEDGHTTINLGGIYDFTDNWHLLFSVGRDIDGDNLLISYFALQLTF